MMTEEPRLARLIEMVSDFNERYVARWLELAPDIMAIRGPGMQAGPMLSPALFRKYIQPVFRRIMQPAQ